MAVATSITALPVLAAIARERGIAGSTAGVTAISAAGIMDVAAWVVLAAALAGTASRPGRPWPVTMLLIACFATIMLLVVRPLLHWWLRRRLAVLSNHLLLALALALGSAWVTASLGLHPVFGGFLAGLAMPSRDGAADAEILQPMQQIADLFLPLFFVVTGLSLNIGAFDGRAFVLLAIVCVAVAAGKLIPGYVASRLGGLRRADSATVAILVTTRGLTELIALNVGLSAGLIDQQLFSVLVLMALITTAMVPLLLRLLPRAQTPPVSGSRDLAERTVPG
jgi:Kef-type K+ transport system membrane component KefB